MAGSGPCGLHSSPPGRSDRNVVRPWAESLENREDDPAESRRIGEDVRCYRTDAGVAARRQRQVPPPIRHLRFPAAMVSTTIALDDEPPFDDEVHSTDSVDPHLALKLQTEGTQQESYERLGARLTLPVDQSAKSATAARHQPEQFVQAVLIDQAEV